eukprot:scaffold205392_cov35-Tisochrysis_lutea.AAC.1
MRGSLPDVGEDAGAFSIVAPGRLGLARRLPGSWFLVAIIVIAQGARARGNRGIGARAQGGSLSGVK